jgi:selenide,water dikinase
MAPEALAQVLRPLQDMFLPADYPELIVGLGSPDDAAVYRMDAERALIITADFFTPVVDDPYSFGAIAAANALSDVYAMGGEPLVAINLVAFPPELPDLLGEVLRGGAEKVREAGIALAGGHTIRDREPKYGLSVVGLAHPDNLITKGGARPGDRLFLTKPLGTGVIVTAFKRDRADLAHLEMAVHWMTALNQKSSRIARELRISSGTDITGFGLLGHGWEMTQASGVGMRLRLKDIPLMDGALEYAGQDLFPAGSRCNRDYFSPQVRFASGITEGEQMLLFDAQTSGGLLLAVPPDKVDRLILGFSKEGQSIWLVGEVVTGPGIEVI